MRLCYENAKAENIVWNNTLLPDRFSAEKMYKKFVDLVYAQAPQQTVVNDMDEIEQLFAEAL